MSLLNMIIFIGRFLLNLFMTWILLQIINYTPIIEVLLFYLPAVEICMQIYRNTSAIFCLFVATGIFNSDSKH